ncbi:predicted protein [Chaetomium globosum CBS 148.51]|uniref:Uncharacterized protein n=1 Tax=Chaetomium globosum (strain ATCC 6205 / CBS 148.51 / DSM 1962 / NBRC 6347 / NRRL 1970) TaxID=306901 RepID=Q2GYQ0_CHAGB|nr:uncharacterized protein CHGG_06904 [Chaetomium globosum CBS 148.51]EAQ85651.1 predicted protein [Chaetomium globosum CBS 148.51]
MDGSEDGLGEDHYPWPTPEASRGVSTSSPKPPHGPSTTGPSSVTVTAWTRRSRSPRTSSRGSSTKRHSGSSDGIGGQASKGKAMAPMAGSSGHVGYGLEGTEIAEGGGDGTLGLQFGDEQFRPLPSADSAVPRHFSFSRPPLPPPLTPPTLHDGAFFPFEDRRPSYAVSVPPALDTSFIHQPNPEYGASSSSADVLGSSPPTATTFPRRRSYIRNVPIDIHDTSRQRRLVLFRGDDDLREAQRTHSPHRATRQHRPSSHHRRRANTSCHRRHHRHTSLWADPAGRAFSYPNKRLICKVKSYR